MTSKRYRGLPPQVSLPTHADPDASGNSQHAPGRSRRLYPYPSTRPPNYLEPSAQRRLMTLVAMLVLVFVLMGQAREPRHWRWLWGFDQTAAPTVEQAVPPLVDPAGAVEPTSTSQPGWPAGLERDLLHEVRDDRHFRASERDAWFGLWRLLRETSSEDLQQQSLGPVSYLQIAGQTAAYRGRLVELSGTIRRIYHVDAPANDLDIARYTQCWLFPDSNAAKPIVLYVLDFPSSVPAADDVALPTDVIGIVYKRWNYLSAEGMDIAPVVLAKTVTIHTPPPQQPVAASNRPLPLVALVATTAGSLLTAALLFRYASNYRRSRNRAADLPQTLPPLSFGSAESSEVETEHHHGRPE